MFRFKEGQGGGVLHGFVGVLLLVFVVYGLLWGFFKNSKLSIFIW